jgi:Natural resistance-associated macrophage protein
MWLIIEYYKIECIMLDSGSREEKRKEDQVEENYNDNNDLHYEKDIISSKLSHFLPKRSPIKSLGPRIITGAADEDPSTIGTYSQAGAQFGFGLLWLALFQYPMIAVVQEMCARRPILGLIAVL